MTEIISAAASLDDLTAQIKMKLVENHVLTNAFNRNINQNSIEIGQMLTQAKKLVKHGQWQFWLQDNFQMTDRTAQRYMKIARYFGISGVVKNDIMSVFNPTALIELTKLPATEVQNFLDMQMADGVDFTKLKITDLSKAIKKWKNPIQEVQPVTVDVDAQISNVPPTQTILKLPAPTFQIVPSILQDAADNAGISISITFSRSIIHIEWNFDNTR